jgi:membrane-associated phospholipid phosphatase
MPRGGRDLARQLLIWLGFAVVYETARGLAHGSAVEAQRNARDVISFEQGLGAFFEPWLQHHAIDASQTLITAANWTYWIAEFGVVTIVLAWSYVRYTDHYVVLRNALIATNAIGYVGYVLVPTAPPRLVPGHGFVDTLAGSSALNHGTPIVAFAANRYAAIPSVHTADAIVVGVAMATLCVHGWVRGIWLVWPVWVSFSLIVTANHFWLDTAAGALVAVLGGGIAVWVERRHSAR